MAKVYQKKKKRDSLNCSSLRNSSSIALEKCFVDHHRCAASVPSPVAFHLHLSALVVFGSLFSSSQVLTAFEREFELRTTNAWDWHENQLYQPHSPTHHPHWLLSSSSASNTASLHTALNKSKQSCKWLEFAAANQWASHGPDFGTKTTSNLVEGVRGNEPDIWFLPGPKHGPPGHTSWTINDWNYITSGLDVQTQDRLKVPHNQSNEERSTCQMCRYLSGVLCCI